MKYLGAVYPFFALALLAGRPVFAGTFSSSLFTGDADSGLSSSLEYTALVDVAGSGARTVNGLAFSDFGTSGTFYQINGLNYGVANAVTNVTGGSAELLRDFYFSTAGTTSMTLRGLTIGEQYVTTWYNMGWGLPNGRVINITPSDTGSAFSFDQNFSGDANGNLLSYTFLATATSITYNFAAVNSADSFHFYAFSNQGKALSLVTPTVTSLNAPNAQPFAPFTPSNNDLLQTSLLSATGTDPFTSEGAGGLSQLTDGYFSLSGTASLSNARLATIGNNQSITFLLDTSTNILGYDIDRIETFGGWNDRGRDAQRFTISYSLVDSAEFVLLGTMNENPDLSPGLASAIYGLFDTDLSGVDGIRFDFPDGQDSGYAGYGEFDVIGVATVPEPASAGLLLLAGVGLIARRKRRAV